MLIVAGIGVRSISSILLIRLGLQFLGEQQFGLWVLLQSLVMYLNLSDLGIGQGIMNAQASMAEKRDRSGAIRVLSSGATIFAFVACLVLVLSNGAVAMLPGLWTSNVLTYSEFQNYFLILSALSMAALPFSAFSASLGGLRDLEVRYLWDITLVIAMAVATGAMFATGRDMLWILAAPLIVQLVWCFASVALVAIRHSRVSFAVSSVSKPVVRSLVNSSAFIFLMSLALLTQRYSANFIVGSFVSVESVAKVHPHVVLFQIFGWALVDAATRAMLPFITGIGVRGDELQLKQITVISAKVSTMAAVCFSLGILLVGPELMQLWLKKDMFLGFPIVAILGLIFILDSPAAVFTNISIATERHRFRAFGNIGYAIASVFGGIAGAILTSDENRILGMFAGFLGASILFHFIVFPVVMRRDLKLSYRTWLVEILLRPLSFFGVGIAVTKAARAAIPSAGVANSVSFAVTVILALALVAFGLFNSEERKWLGRKLGISIWKT